MKSNKLKIAISSLAVILPLALMGLILFLFPDKAVKLQGMQLSRAMFYQTVTTVSLLLSHWLVLFFAIKDKDNRDQNRKIIGLIYSVVPVISLISAGIAVKIIWGVGINSTTILLIFFGLFFVVFGNYMPKCKRNSVIGVRIKWTLESEENWNATHRFAGKMWFIGGVCSLIAVFLPIDGLLIPLVIVAIIITTVPILYSYMYYKKNGAKESYGKDRKPQMDKVSKIVIIAAVITTIVVGLLLEVGSVKAECLDDSVALKCTFWDNSSIKYDEIENVEWLDKYSQGQRDFGYGSFTLGAGAFSNSRFGAYTLYAYNKTTCGVAIKTKSDLYVVSLEDEATTKEFYEELLKQTR